MELDLFELVGIAASLIVGLFLMRSVLPDGDAHGLLRLCALAAWLALTAGSFVARSLRRARRLD